MRWQRRRRRGAAGAGRQGRLLRHRRHLDQAGAGHGGHEVRHGRGRGRVRRHAGARRRARRAANVVGVVGLVENMPSGTAQRPGDVVRSMAGKTIEVINTDAEGRLVLADVLHYARDRFKPKAMVDLATLTGAVIVALGHEQAGLFSNDEALAGATCTRPARPPASCCGGCRSGKAYEKHIKSDIADIKNVGRGREAGSTAGAVFLQQFVGDTPWAHLDIAGTAWSSRDLPLAGQGRHRLRRAPARPAGGRHEYETCRLDRGRLLPPDAQHARGGAAAAAGEGLCGRPSGGACGSAIRSGSSCSNRALWTYGKDSLPAARHPRRRLRRGPADLSHRRRSRTRTARTILVLVDDADAPRPRRLRPLPRPVRRRRRGRGRAGARALARGAAAGHSCIYWQQSERGGWVKAREDGAGADADRRASVAAAAAIRRAASTNPSGRIRPWPPSAPSRSSSPTRPGAT